MTMEGLRDVPAQWLSSEGIRKGIDTVCQESALSISISDGRELSFSLGITMRTPGCDKELVIGLLFSEGIINSSDQISDLLGETSADTTAVAVDTTAVVDTTATADTTTAAH